MHIKFEESNAFVKNVAEIDSLGEDIEKISLKDSPMQEDKPKMSNMVKFKMIKWSQHNHSQRIGDILQIITKTSL